MRILIIEDEPKIAEVISSRLKKENYVVDINKNGEEGLDNALTNIYDLIILDVMLPKINGFEILKQIGKEKIEANIVLKLCEYKGYSAIYAVIDYGFENSDVWEQTSEAWLNIKNSQTPEALPEATLGVTVTGKGLPDPILTVCSFYPDIFDL